MGTPISIALEKGINVADNNNASLLPEMNLKQF